MIVTSKIIMHEIYNGKLEKGYFSSLKYHKLRGKNLVILRADSGVCYICQMVSPTSSREYFQIDKDNTKCFVKSLVCGTTDENFIDVINDINQNPDKYLREMI